MLRATVPQKDLLPDYLKAAVGESVHLQQVSPEGLPVHLQRAFTFLEGNILGMPHVFAVPHTSEKIRPAMLAKQLQRIESVLQLPTVAVLESLSARDRERLVARRTPFVVPFSHAFFPHILLDAREHTRPRFSTLALPVPETIVPATQLVFLHMLLQDGTHTFYAKDLADSLQISAMTVSRALKELEAITVITRPLHGRPRPVTLAGSRAEMWRNAQPFLQSPVRERFVVRQNSIPHSTLASYTALAELSDLAPPAEPIIAVSHATWLEIVPQLEVEPHHEGLPEPGELLVEVWAYDPKRLSSAPHIDVLSLFLTLQSEHDERVESALEQALMRLEWLRD